MPLNPFAIYASDWGYNYYFSLSQLIDEFTLKDTVIIVNHIGLWLTTFVKCIVLAYLLLKIFLVSTVYVRKCGINMSLIQWISNMRIHIHRMMPTFHWLHILQSQVQNWSRTVSTSKFLPSPGGWAWTPLALAYWRLVLLFWASGSLSSVQPKLHEWIWTP